MEAAANVLTTTFWIYPIGNGKDPGCYANVIGYNLECDGSFLLSEGEDFRDVVDNLCEDLIAYYALVECELDEDGEVVSRTVIDTHYSQPIA